jgi:conjugal transfer ATP-binding protein TraC
MFRVTTEEQRSLTSLLPYWTVQDGVLVLSDGSYQLGFASSLPPGEIWSSRQMAEFNAQIRRLLNHAIPEGECLRVFLEVHPDYGSLLQAYSQGLRASHPALQTIHRWRVRELSEQHAAGRLANYRLTLTLSYRPGRSGRRWQPIDRPTYQAHLRTLGVMRDILVANCERAGIPARPLHDQEYVEVIWRYFNPSRKRYLPPPEVPRENQRVEVPPAVLKQFSFLARPSVRTRVARSDLYRRYNYLWVDDQFVKIVALDRLFGEVTRENMLRELLLLPYDFWLIVEYWNDPRTEAIKRLEIKSRMAYAARYSNPASDREDPKSAVISHELEEILRRLHSSDTRIFRAGAAVVLHAPSLEVVREAAHHTVDAFHQAEAEAIDESVGLLSQFISLAPFSGLPNERLCRVLTENAADLFPSLGPWSGSPEPTCLFWNRFNGLTPLDPFDPRAPAWNGVVVGETGSGKTYLTHQLLLQLLARDAEVIIVDRGGSYRTLVTLLEGQHIPVDPTGTISLNPFDLPGGEKEPDDEKISFLVALIGLMVKEGGADLTRVEKALIESAARQTYLRAGGEPVFLHDFVRRLRTMEEIGSLSMDAQERSLANSLATRLQQWTGEATYAKLLDRPTNVYLDRDLVYFDTEGLDRSPDLLPIVILLLTDMVWRRIRQETGRRKLVVIDEAWILLANPIAGHFLDEIFRRFRRYGAGVLAISQKLEDFHNEYARGVLANAQFKYLLRVKDIAQVAELADLNDCQQKLLSSLTQVKGRYSEVLCLVDLTHGREGGVLVVRGSSLDDWIATSSDSDRAKREEAIQACGNLWDALQHLARAEPRGMAAGGGSLYKKGGT